MRVRSEKENKMREVQSRIDGMNKLHTAQVKQVCDRLGYGFVMQQASVLWNERDYGAGHSVGPSRVCTVPCGCKVPCGCDWCCGSGWLTKKVKKIKDRFQGFVSLSRRNKSTKEEEWVLKVFDVLPKKPV